MADEKVQGSLLDQSASETLQVDKKAEKNKPAKQKQEEAVDIMADVQDDAWYVFRLVDTKRKGEIGLSPTCDLVLNPKTGKREKIWLVSGFPSIWTSDLTELLKDTAYVNQNLRYRDLVFRHGHLRAPGYDRNLIEFLRHCRDHIANPSKRTGGRNEFFEHNPAKAAREAMERENLELEMVLQASKLDEKAADKLALFFRISPFDDFGMKKPPEAITRELMKKAKENPENFKKYMGSKEVEVSYLVKKAISTSKIELSPNGAIWSGAGKPIVRIPAGQEPVDYLVSFALNGSKEGADFQKDLSIIVN